MVVKINRYLIYRAEDGRLRPHAEAAYRALCGHAAGVLIDATDEALRQAWAEAMCAEWDELLLVTDALMGPLHPESLQTMFDSMDAKAVDGWSLAPVCGPGKDGGALAIPSFLAVRRKWLERSSLRELMAKGGSELMLRLLGVWQTETQAVGSVAPSDAFADGPADPLVLQPYTAVVNCGCPFIDLRCLTIPHALTLRCTMGEEPGRLLRWMKETGVCDVKLVWDWLLAGRFDLNVVANLGLMACLPTTPPAEVARYPRGKCCLLMHLYFTELGEEALHYARSMPPEADICITTTSAEKKAYYETLFACLPNRVEVRQTVNRGRDMGSLLVSLRDVTRRYELCCFYHDKKSSFCATSSVGRSFAYLISESALASPGYVQRILRLFDEEPRLGVLCAMAPHHADYYAVNARFWDHNLEPARELLSRLGLSMSAEADRVLPAAWGNVFWFRVKALAPLLNYPWRYEDFPEEPYPVDGSVAHAMERIHCLVAESQGYYTSLAAPDHLAAQMMMNFHQYLCDYVKEMDGAQLLGMHHETIRQLSRAVNCHEIRARRGFLLWLRRLMGDETFQRCRRMVHRERKHKERIGTNQ